MKPLHLTLLAAPLLAGLLPAAPALDADKLLTTEDFWLNKDFDWYKNSIPIFDCPDKEILTTYYYRWELVTRHLVYGNPNTGYAFTEFANRPGWSGAYGTIACPAGLQINDVRWLHNPRFVRDYLRFWMRHPGAQPRNYSFWAADSTWSAYLVQPNNDFVTDLLPDLIHNLVRAPEPAALFQGQCHRMAHWRSVSRVSRAPLPLCCSTPAMRRIRESCKGFLARMT